MDFKELADERHRVRELCRKHVPSLSVFKYSRGPSFKLTWDEDEKKPGKVHLHLTSTATCIESLRDCHQIFRQQGTLRKIAASVGVSEKEAIKQLAASFYSKAFKQKKWLSEQSAPVYCASRALPLFLDGTSEWTLKHAELVKSVYAQLAKPERFGIGEQNLKPEKGPLWYPENAYHTYWALRVLREIRGRFENKAQRAIGLNLDRHWEGMRLWARAKLAEEVGLHWDQSATLDSDQLTWALTTFIEFEGDLSSDLRSQDLIRKAFDALGSTQQPVGTWRHYQPLFVYSDVGNAYCYVYESFTFLLKAILQRFGQQEFLEHVIGEFIGRLQKLREYAERTQVRHDKEPDAVGWSSGHKPAGSKPEGWATASVFSFLQAYRRLLGVLARREALRALRVPALGKTEDPLKELYDRGNTWLPPGKTDSVAEQLITLFVYPTKIGQRRDASEPDDQPIQELQARSAILFGPPGTSKTRLARCVAEALGWEYIELYSSHFVAEGIGAIQRTADRLFAFLMELDHAVVLFDEPDELVREREGSPDAFGRFLTTSMLPKLAELWKQRRIIYFVATNHISYFDAAIIRSERFDVVVSVPPPSFEKKVGRLEECLNQMGVRNVSIQVTLKEVAAKLDELSELDKKKGASGTKDKPWPGDEELASEAQLAKLVLLRWDQIDELASRLASRSRDKEALIVDSDLLTAALKEISDPRLSKLQAYVDYLAGLRYVRRDFQRKPLFSVRKCPSAPRVRNELEEKDGHLYLKCKSGDCPEKLAGYRVVRTGIPGKVDILDSRK